MRRSVLIALSLTLLGFACVGRTNPTVSPEVYIFSISWFLKTIPLDYAVDLIALSIALFATGEIVPASWKWLPLYNLPVCAAGLVADIAARKLAGVDALHTYVQSRRDPVMGPMFDEFFDPDRGLLVGGHAVLFMISAAALIFLFNVLIIHTVLSLNDADSRSRLPLAAGIMAVVTAPYLDLVRGSTWVSVFPALIFAITLGVHTLLAKRRKAKEPALKRKLPRL